MHLLTHSAGLYFTSVFIWGSTFFAIKFQLGEVPEELSVAYRFALAAALLFAWCLARGVRLRFAPRQLAWMALQGLSLFCVNYVLIYWATVYLTSGLVAVLFSTIVLMNIVNGALIFRRPVSVSMVAGALLGVAGIALVFRPELAHLDTDAGALRGLALALLGTYVASLGNMVSARNQRYGLPVIQTNAWGMAASALMLTLAALAQGTPFAFEFTPGYALSMLYLALFGSVIAFGSYLTLLGRIGPEKAAYAMVLFPLVALAISTVFENYLWTPSAIAGVALVALGNVLIIVPPALRSRVRAALGACLPGRA